MPRRSLVGTRAGYAPCPVCRHMTIRHEQRGRGRCTHVEVRVYRDAAGAHTGSETVRCDCAGLVDTRRGVGQ